MALWGSRDGSGDRLEVREGARRTRGYVCQGWDRPAGPDGEGGAVEALHHEDWGHNTVVRIPLVEGDADAAVAESNHVLEDEIRIQRYTTAPIETRGYVSDRDAAEESLTFYGAGQNPHPLRWVLSHALGLPEGPIRVVAPRVGTRFGLRLHGHPEETLVCVLSWPVKWIEDREETFVIGGREQPHTFKVAVNDDGNITALRNNIVANVAAVGAPLGWGRQRLRLRALLLSVRPARQVPPGAHRARGGCRIREDPDRHGGPRRRARPAAQARGALRRHGRRPHPSQKILRLGGPTGARDLGDARGDKASRRPRKRGQSWFARVALGGSVARSCDPEERGW